jgi:hypothetical protein
MNVKNALVIGSGSKFGLSITDELKKLNFNVYGISGTAQNQNTLTVDWKSCFINDFEKFLRKMPVLDIVIFNQNASALPSQFHDLGSINTIEVWKHSKQFLQSYYVNCVLPGHVLHTLSQTEKLNQDSKIIWLLSKSIFNPEHAPSDYVGQKYQNYVTLQKLAHRNSQTFMGVCPGKLNENLYTTKSQYLCNFLLQENINQYSGKFLEFDQHEKTFKIYQP